MSLRYILIITVGVFLISCESNNVEEEKYKIVAQTSNWKEPENPRKFFYQTLQIIKEKDTTSYIYIIDSVYDVMNDTSYIRETANIIRLVNDSILILEKNDTLQFKYTDKRILAKDTIQCMIFEPQMISADGLFEFAFNRKIGVIEEKGGWNTYFKILQIERID